MTQLDAVEQGERDWLVVTARHTERLTPRAETVDYTEESNIKVRAASMAVVDGALVFLTPSGELSVAFGPGGWLEVIRA